MAVLFSEIHDGVTYEVRQAGASLRLYTDQAFHSQYNPRHLFSGGVWDLLALPALAMPRPPASVLVLGVGGGAVIHQLHRLLPAHSVTGIEIDPIHVQLGLDFFSLNYPALTLINDCAKHWLNTSEASFDYIVDDVFLHGEADPARPFDTDTPWFDVLRAHLNPGGTIVQNHIDRQHARVPVSTGTALRFTTDYYENNVVAWFDSPATASVLKRLLEKQLAQRPRQETAGLRYQCRPLRRA